MKISGASVTVRRKPKGIDSVSVLYHVSHASNLEEMDDAGDPKSVKLIDVPIDEWSSDVGIKDITWKKPYLWRADVVRYTDNTYSVSRTIFNKLDDRDADVHLNTRDIVISLRPNRTIIPTSPFVIRGEMSYFDTPCQISSVSFVWSDDVHYTPHVSIITSVDDTFSFSINFAGDTLVRDKNASATIKITGMDELGGEHISFCSLTIVYNVEKDYDPIDVTALFNGGDGDSINYGILHGMFSGGAKLYTVIDGVHKNVEFINTQDASDSTLGITTYADGSIVVECVDVIVEEVNTIFVRRYELLSIRS